MTAPDEPVLPLGGVRVLELASVLAGPYAGAMLQRLGAEVVKVESPEGDPFRNWSVEGSPHFAQFNVGKKSIVVDLGDRRGVAAIKALLPTADVLVQNSRPGRMERLGLGAEECMAVNPQLVWVGMSGFGTTGPMSSRPAYDAIGQSVSGLLGLLGQHGGRPLLGPALGDMATGIIGAMAALTGVVTRERTGRGVVVETSMLEAVVALIADAFTQFSTAGVPPTDALRGRQSQVYALAGSDGEYVAIHLSTSQKFYAKLVRALGRDDLEADARFAAYQDRIANYDMLRAELEAVFALRTAAEWEEVLVANDVPASRVLSLGDVLSSPHIAAMGLFGGDGGVGSVPYLRAPFVVDGHRPPIVGGVPRLGEHTVEVLDVVLGSAEVAALHRDGVVRTDDDFMRSTETHGAPR